MPAGCYRNGGALPILAFMSAYKLGPTGRIVLSPAQRHTSVLLERQACERPRSPFLTIEGRTYSYQTAHERVLRVAAGLAGLGVTEGSRIGLLLPNVAAFVFLWLASSHLGATIVAINPQFRGRLLDTALGDTECSVVVLHAASADALASVAAPIRARITAVVAADAETVGRDGVVSLSAWMEAPSDAVPATQGDLRSVQVISFTSGSTGPAKGVLITTNQALDAACTYVHAMNLTSDDTLYTPFAFFHGMSTRLGILPALIVGAHVAVAERFSASRYWQEAGECGATVAQTLPTMTALIKALPPGPNDRAHKVTRMYNSRADEDFERRFGVRLVEAYGMTEIGLPIYSGFPDRRAGAAGKVHPDWEMAIVDEQDLPVPAGQPGELVFRPRLPWLITPGYVGRPDATVEANRNLWFHSGDIGRQDEDGWVYFIDRRKERIRRLGENISSFDVESLVAAHPDVRECAALAYPAAHGEDDVRIVVVAAEDSQLGAAALYDWLTGVMPKYMLPRYIEFTQSLPRTPTNKIEKFQLKDAGLGAEVWDRDVHRPSERSLRALRKEAA
jgi:carnitine-CoA ligase